MFVLILLFTVALVLILRYYYRKKNLIDSLPPGPKPLPFVGNILQIDAKDPRKTYLKWRQLYGPVYTCWVGETPFVHVCNYEFMHESMIKHGEDYVNRPTNWMFEYVLKGKNGILIARGENWKEQRRFALQTLKNFGVGRKLMEEKIIDETTRFLNSIEENLSKSKDNIVDFEDDISSCVCNVISSLLVGRSFKKTDPTLHRFISATDQLLKLLMDIKSFLLYSCSWLRFVPFFGHFGFDSFRSLNDTILNFISNEIERHKKDVVELTEEPNDFISAYLQEIKKRKEIDPASQQFNEWRLLCVLYDLWIAGMETTVTTLRWAFVLMIRFPDVQRKVQTEIESVIGSKRSPTMSDKNLMPYTQAVLNEVQRYSNIISSNFPRLTVRDGLTIGGHQVPKGVAVVPQISVANMDPMSFENPQTFDPYHFLQSDGVTLKKVEEFMPFSIGKRMCLGEGLARMELFLVFVSFIQKYRLMPSTNEPEPSLEPEVRFTMGPKSYRCLIEKRVSFERSDA